MGPTRPAEIERELIAELVEIPEKGKNWGNQVGRVLLGFPE